MINQITRELAILVMAKPAKLELLKPILLERIPLLNQNSKKRRRLIK
jgi:hypothetical protein